MSTPQKLIIDSIELRLAQYPWYVSRCGKYAVDHRKKHVLRRYTTPGRKARILMTPSGPSMHRMVGTAWVYNPAPGIFFICDHIDGDIHNNDASNLRWVNCSLNNLNRLRLPWIRVKYLKKLKHRVAVYYYYRAASCVGDQGDYEHFKNPEKAREATGALLNNSFRRVYRENTPEEYRPTRSAWHFYWRDDMPAELYCTPRFRLRESVTLEQPDDPVHDTPSPRESDDKSSDSAPQVNVCE